MELLYCPHCAAQIQAPAHGGAALQCVDCGAPLTVAATTPDNDQWPLEEITLVAPLDETAEVAYPQQAVADADVLEDEQLREYTPRRRIPFEVFFFLTILVVLLGFGVSAAALLLYFRPGLGGEDSTRRDTASQFVAVSNADDQKPHRWLPAGEGALRLGKTKVEVVRAEWSEARGKDASGMVIISDQRFLHVILRIENTDLEPIEYHSWYGNDFPLRDGAVRVRLTDNVGRDYPWVIFDDLERVRWHLPLATIEPRKYIEDVIIFEVPPEIDRGSVEYLRLSLPAAALGREGFYYFELPRDMIVDF